MTSPVNSFHDILDAFDQNPNLRDQLRRFVPSEELLQLPAQLLILQQDLGRIHGRLGNIEGNQYEQSTARRILPRLLRLGITVPRIAFSQFDQRRPSFHRTIACALRNGRISPDEVDDLTESDLIVYGNSRRRPRRRNPRPRL